MTESPPPEMNPLPALPATWAWNSQAPPPGSGQVRTDSRDWMSASVLCVDKRTDGGLDVSTDLAAVKPGDSLRLEHNTDPTRWARYTVVGAPVLVIDHYQYAVAYAAGNGILPNSGTRIKLSAYSSTAPAGDVVSVAFQPVQPWAWLGTASCKHGQVSTSTFTHAPDAPLNYAGMVQQAWRQQDLLNACNCPNQAAQDNAVVTLQMPLTLQPGERRVLQQSSAALTGTNFVFGPLTCQKSGAYAIQGSLQLAGSVASGARGNLSVVVGAVNTYTFPLVDVGGKATTSISGLVNMRQNESVMLVFDNLSSSSQTLQTLSFKVGAVWVP